MRFTSALAIYALFWSLSFFFVLPFRLRADDADDEAVPGQAESAPPRFSFARTAFWTTIVSAALFGLYYLNYINGWIGPEAVDFFTPRRGPSGP
jgi:predicted secreted protein